MHPVNEHLEPSNAIFAFGDSGRNCSKREGCFLGVLSCFIDCRVQEQQLVAITHNLGYYCTVLRFVAGHTRCRNTSGRMETISLASLW